MTARLITHGRALLFALIVVVAVFAAWRWWQLHPAAPVWTDEREGDGAVLALASGTDSQGNDIVAAGGYFRTDASGRDLRIVCFNAGDGRVRWEMRDNRALPNMSKVPALEVDPEGNVLVGWDYWSVGSGRHPVIAKLSGTDGKKVWEWTAFSAGEQSGHLAVPKADDFGRVWAAGIHEQTKGHYQRFLALLDSRNGTAFWEVPLNAAHDANDRRTAVHPLKSGNAIAVSPPQERESRSPWLLQFITAGDGAMRWSKELLRENERGLPALTWIVDEASGQLIVFWATVISGKGHLERIAYDLATGAEKWRFNDPWGDDFVGGVLDATLDGNSVAAWGRYGYETHRVKWWRWHYDEGFLFPETETTSHERPLRIRYLCATGTMTDRTEIERADERIQRILTARDSAAKVLFLREMKARQQMEPWRAVRLPAGGALGGPAASLDFPGYAVLTPGGRIVVAGDLMQRREMWRITVW